MLDKVIQTIKQYNMLSNYDKIVIGLSGGGDSVCLLHVLCELQKKYHLTLTAVHVHHGLRDTDADGDLSFVKDLCQKLSISLEIFHFQIREEAKRMRVSLEEAGRMKRYESFENILQKIGGQKIAVAHNQNDNAETVLMNLFRGAGLTGLSGIAPHPGRIVRPLLFCTRNEIENYLDSRQLSYRNDLSNQETVYTRNKIRHLVLPLVRQEINPGVIQTVSKTSILIRDENDFLEQEAQKYLDTAITQTNENKINLHIPALLPLHPALQRRIMRLALKNANQSLKDFSYDTIALCMEILNKPSGKKFNLPDNITVEKQYNTLLIYKSIPNVQNGFCYSLRPDEIIFIKEIQKYVLATFDLEKFNLNPYKLCTKIFDYDKMEKRLQVRTRKSGDSIYLKHMRKKIKDIFIDLKIPREQRAYIPLVCAGDDIIWIFDIRTSYYFSGLDSKNKIFIAFWEECIE